MTDINWTEGRQACRPEDLELFYPIGPTGRRSTKFGALGDEAKAICKRCDIRELCLEEALKEERTHEAHGIRGGLDADERIERAALMNNGAA